MPEVVRERHDEAPPAGAARDLDPSERASIARLLEAAVEALRDERLDTAATMRLVGHLWGLLDTAALYVRQGDRAGLLDRLTATLDRVRQQLTDPDGAA